MEELTSAEKKLFKRLNTPAKIQDFLNRVPINFEKNGETCVSPRRMLEAHKAHCLEGALFAAAVLQFHGSEPLLLDLKAKRGDFDHVVALFQKDGYWGAISKTNHAVLRYREPVYKTIRELVLSYFHEYFLDTGKKTLRSYSKPFNLKKYSRKNWIIDSKNLWYISADLDASPHLPIVPKQILARLRRADQIEIAAGKITEWKKK